MLATLSKEVVSGPGWVYEEKYDGIRLVAHRERGKVRLDSRNLIDRTASFPDLALAIRALPNGDVVIDGEVFARDVRRVSRFQLLQQRRRPMFAAFDLLMFDGRSLTRRPLAERRASLEQLLKGARAPLLLARRLARDGEAAYRVAKERDWEGIIAKDERSTYTPGERSRSWRKVKVRREAEFVIGGYTAPRGARTSFGALLVGMFDGKTLRYVGKVGTGFTASTLRDLLRRMASLRTERAPFDPVPRMKDATWVRPRLVGQVAYAEWTTDGKLRQPAFLGLRTDKAAREVRWAERE